MSSLTSSKKQHRGDPEVIAAAISLVYYSGLKKREIIKIKIRDVVDVLKLPGKLVHGYSIRNKVDVFATGKGNSSCNVQITPESTQALKRYLNYLLNSTRYDTKLGAPLFSYQREKYKPKTLENHILYYTEKHFPNASAPINLKKIRQSGLIHYYVMMLKQRHGNKAFALNQTAKFARHSEQHTDYLLYQK